VFLKPTSDRSFNIFQKLTSE
ncbi:hypothetical protein SNEBB_011299, partial [Seison nebaliae]